MTVRREHTPAGTGGRSLRTPNNGVLIVIDQSRGSRRVLTYVVRILGRHRGLRLCLVHLAPPAMAAMKDAARRAFAGAQAALRRAGVTTGALDTQFFGAPDPRGLADHILELSRTSHCRTVVLGRAAARYGSTDLAAQLVGRAAGVTIWIVA
ncbi:MAG: universal stress protein [bacterium]